MSQRKVSLAYGEFYHIYNRGNSKQIIYKDAGDHIRFQQMLYVMNAVESATFRFVGKDQMYRYDRGEQLVAIGAYALMPNHFHILLTPVIEHGVSIFMKKLLTGYSMYFNKRYERRGALFEGRFKSKHAISDEYLKYLFSYIHLNPLKLVQSDWKEVGLQNIQGGEKYLNEYRFSSYLDYKEGNRVESKILNVEKFPEFFPTKELFVKEIQDWMKFQDFV